MHAHNLILAENKKGANLMISGNNNHRLDYSDILVYSKVRTDCPECYSGAYSGDCSMQIGLILPNTVIGGAG